jgi:hypothetical protein
MTRLEVAIDRVRELYAHLDWKFKVMHDEHDRQIAKLLAPLTLEERRALRPYINRNQAL